MKGRGSTELECPVCRTIFKRSNTDIRAADKKGYEITCSNKCRYENQSKLRKKKKSDPHWIEQYFPASSFVGPPRPISLKHMKVFLTKAIRNACTVPMIPEARFMLQIILQAVEDIGVYETKEARGKVWKVWLDSPNCWDDGSLDLYCHFVGIDPEYLRVMVIGSGLYKWKRGEINTNIINTALWWYK